MVADADVVFDEAALLHLALPFVLDDRTVATSGMIRPQNGCAIEDGRLAPRDIPGHGLTLLPDARGRYGVSS